jgi:hypothetical protein
MHALAVPELLDARRVGVVTGVVRRARPVAGAVVARRERGEHRRIHTQQARVPEWHLWRGGGEEGEGQRELLGRGGLHREHIVGER